MTQTVSATAPPRRTEASPSSEPAIDPQELPPEVMDEHEPSACADCGVTTPGLDLLFSERGRVCLDCHGEAEVSQVDLSPWRHAVPTLALIGLLTALTVILPLVGRLVFSLGPTGAVAWIVMTLLPAVVGGVLVIAALRLLRDAWTNPLDEELPLGDWLVRMGTSGLAVLASVASTLSLPILALWPFL